MGDKKMTPEKMADFLSRLSECVNVTRAAEESGCSRVQLYTLRSERPEFFEAWEKAAKIGAARLEDEARRRAVEGWQEPVWYQGEEVGAVRKYSDTLLICLLKAHHPEKYADRSENKTTLAGSVEVSHSLAPELQSVLDSVYGSKTEESAK